MSEVILEVEKDPLKDPMIEVLLQDVQIFQDHVRVTLSGGVEKSISLDEFRTILNTAVGRAEETKLDGFNLPAHVFYFAKSGSELQLSCYYATRVAVIQYFQEKIKIVMPNVIVSHVLQKSGDRSWRMQDSKYFCTDFTVSKLPRDFIYRVDHSKHIFLLPMSNTYNEARMCFGHNSMPKQFMENNLRGLDWYYQYMFESPFNDDLGIIATSYGYRVSDWYRFLEKIAADNKPFPYEKLTGFAPA
jgi:hypothetical protein